MVSGGLRMLLTLTADGLPDAVAKVNNKPKGLFGWVLDPIVWKDKTYYLTKGIVLVIVLLLLVAAACVALVYLCRKKHSGAAQPELRTQVPGEPELPETPDGGCIRAAYHQDIGAREDQQDSFTYSDPAHSREKGMLAVVADGMGGLANGAAVSSTIVRVFDEGFRRAPAAYDGAELLLNLAGTANTQVRQLLRGRTRSGSTLVATLIRDGRLYFVSVGDSRIYLWRGGALLQLTREQVYREELALRVLNRTAQTAALRQDRQAGSLTSYFGETSISALDRNAEGIKLVAGDRILLASDGVFGTLGEQQLAELLSGDVHDAADGIGEQIRAADRPYQDNNTAVILEYLG